MKSKNIFHSIKQFVKKNFPQSKKVSTSYKTYAEARDDCIGYGYEDEILVDVVLQKTLRYKSEINNSLPLMANDALLQSMIGILMVQLETQKKTINVIDLGGACGAHYFYVRAALGNKTRLKWHIVETQAMVNKGKTIETEELRFFDNIKTAKKAFSADIDYFHSSGTIQYFPNPEEIIKEIITCNARYVMFSRLALSLGQKEIITLQESMLSANGPGPLPIGIPDKLCKYPVIYYPKERLEKLIRENYSIALRFGELMANVIDNQTIISTGYFVERLN